MDNVIMLGFVTLTIFSLMFAVGLNHTPEQLTFLWSRPALLLGSLLAVIVLVPVVVGLLLRLFDLPPDVATALAIAGIARNVGLAMFIAQLCDYGQNFVPTLLTYMILGALLAVPYSVGSKRRLTLSEAA